MRAIIALTLTTFICSAVSTEAAVWKYVEETDAMTDARKQYVLGVPDGADPANSPIIRIGCYGAQDDYPMGVSFYWNEPLQRKYDDSELQVTTITFRQNSDEPREMVWAMTRDQATTYPPDVLSGTMSTLGDAIIGSILPGREVANATWTAEQLHFTMLNAERVVFRAYTVGGQSITVAFTMEGYWQAIAPFADHCQGVVGRYGGSNGGQLDTVQTPANAQAAPSVVQPSVASIASPASASPPAPKRRSDIWSHKWTYAADHLQHLRQLEPFDGEYRISATTMVSMLELRFLPDWQLIKIRDNEWEGSLHIFYLVSESGDYIRLERGPPILDQIAGDLRISAGTVADYLWFHTFFAEGEDAPALIVESKDDFAVPKGAAMEQASPFFEPILCAKSGYEYRCAATMMEENAIYEGEFIVQGTGEVNLTRATRLIGDLTTQFRIPLAATELVE